MVTSLSCDCPSRQYYSVILILLRNLGPNHNSNTNSNVQPRSQATTSKTDEDLFHDSHLQLQERMRNPIAFHAELMGDIMYLQQGLRQLDAMEFIQAVIKEVYGHVDSNNWTLRKQSEVPEEVQIVPSVWTL
jgi:hypothetical protein